tara:strand:+ start:1415 stop:4276 length:2862 start_codon:yes stop_codon:yes gene_type:complete
MVDRKKKIKIIKKKKTVEFKGKKVKYTTINNLAKILNVSKEEAKQIRNKEKRYIVDDENNIGFYSLADDPLILRDFGVKRISNKNFVKGGTTKNLRIFKNLPTNIPYNMILNITFSFGISQDYVTRNYKIEVQKETKDLTEEFFKEAIQNTYLQSVGVETYDLEILEVNTSSSFTQQQFKKEGMELFNSLNNLDISNLYNEVLVDSKWKDCVQDYLKYTYPSFSKKKISTIRTIEDIYNFSVDKNLKMIAYDISGKIITSYYPEKKSRKKNLIFIAYNNHLYPLKNTYLNKNRTQPNNFIYVENAHKKCIEFLEDGILPSMVVFGLEDTIKHFRIEKTLYHNNEEYEPCKKILKSFGLEDKINPTTSYLNIGKILENLYIKENIKSFLPNKFIKGGFNYNGGDIDDIEENIETIDGNKYYTSILLKLKYLISTDIKTHKFTLNPKKITRHHLYVVKPKKSSLIFDKTNIYTGEQVLIGKKLNLDFEVLEELETTIHENHYKQLILDLQQKQKEGILTENAFKTIMNIMIGKFERSNEVSFDMKLNKICNEDEKNRTEGFYKKLNNKWYAFMDKKEVFNVLSLKPIAIQIKDMARLNIYNVLNEIKPKRIIQIKTDCMSFIPINNKYKKLINKELGGYKYEEYKPVKKNCVVDSPYTLKLESNNQNVLGLGYAGCGKTYHIINNIIPKLKGSYIVLTPSHSALKEYRLKKLNCDVIQKYSFSGGIPKEETVIIDEIGMVNSNDFNVIYKCFLKDKKIMAYGDFRQLSPVGSLPCNQPLFLDYIFNIKKPLNKNHRNNFTNQYYDSLLTKNKSYLEKECKKYSTDWKTAQTIICYRNTIKDKFNEKMKEFLKIKNMWDKGCKIISKTNELRHKNIYNKFLYTVKSSNKDNVIINDSIEDIEITKEELLKNFNYGYARTLYSIQGETLSSFHYPQEDYYYLNNCSTYTLISRLKGI